MQWYWSKRDNSCMVIPDQISRLAVLSNWYAFFFFWLSGSHFLWSQSVWPRHFNLISLFVFHTYQFTFSTPLLLEPPTKLAHCPVFTTSHCWLCPVSESSSPSRKEVAPVGKDCGHVRIATVKHGCISLTSLIRYVSSILFLILKMYSWYHSL